MTLGLLNLAYQLAYLLRLSPFFCPALHLSGSRLARDDGSAAVRSPLYIHAEPSCHCAACTSLWRLTSCWKAHSSALSAGIHEFLGSMCNATFTCMMFRIAT
jgi:hypothetical protein